MYINSNTTIVTTKHIRNQQSKLGPRVDIGNFRDRGYLLERLGLVIIIIVIAENRRSAAGVGIEAMSGGGAHLQFRSQLVHSSISLAIIQYT